MRSAACSPNTRPRHPPLPHRLLLPLHFPPTPAHFQPVLGFFPPERGGETNYHFKGEYLFAAGIDWGYDEFISGGRITRDPSGPVGGELVGRGWDDGVEWCELPWEGRGADFEEEMNSQQGREQSKQGHGWVRRHGLEPGERQAGEFRLADFLQLRSSYEGVGPCVL